MIVRPGPDRLAARLAPGGWVAHVYSGIDGRLLHATAMAPGTDVEQLARRDGDLVNAAARPGEPIVFVIYDGDTGERATPLGPPGTRL